MHWHKFCLSALGLGMFACGARVSVGDLGDAAMPDSAVTSGGGTGFPTGTGGTGGSTMTDAAGGVGASGGSTMTGGSGGAGASGGSTTTGGSGGAGASGGSTMTDASGGAGASGGSTMTDAAGGTGNAADASVGTPCGITYPESGFYGKNILFPDYAAFELMPQHYTMAAFVPGGVSLRVRITKLNGSWGLGFSDADWRFMGNPDTLIDFVPIDTGASRVAEANCIFMGNGRARVDFFECGSTTPTRTKIYIWGNGEGDASADHN